MNHKFSKFNTLLAFLFSVSTFQLVAQDSIRISGQLLNNTRFVKIVVQKFGTGVFDIAAVNIDKESGKFSISAPMDVEAGIYRFRYSQTGYGDFIDLIINGNEKDISFNIDVSKEADNRMINFLASEENKTWYQFHQEQKNALAAIRLQEDFINNYPNKKDKTFLNMLKALEKAKQNYNKKHESFINHTSFYWAKNSAQFSKVFFTDVKQHPRLQVFEVHENFWNQKPSNDPKLLNTPLYTDAILNYLQYYLSTDMDFGEEEKNTGLKKCVDTLMLRFGQHTETKAFIVKYLQMGFKELGNEEVLQFIDEKYAATAQCTEDDDELKKRLAGYEALKPGNPAPQISLIDLDSKEKTLFDFKQDNVVLVFWASWCPHCMQEIPKLQAWAKAHPETLVLAISLDEDFTAFQNAIKDFPNMLHYCDLQKWNGEIAKNYFVAATPTIFAIDKERRIKNKFTSIDKILEVSN